jgi:hypothetical protein
MATWQADFFDDWDDASPPISQQEFNQLMTVDNGIQIRINMGYIDEGGQSHITGATFSHLRGGAITYRDTEAN